MKQGIRTKNQEVRIKMIQKYFLVLVSSFLILSSVFAQPAVTLDNLALTVSSGTTLTIQGDFQNQNGGTITNSGTVAVSGNWTNNATNNVFSTNAGVLQFNGTGAQTVGGTYPTSFYDLTLNNSTNFILASNETVKDTLTLTSGITNLSGYSLTLGSSSSSPGVLNYTGGWLYGGTLTRWFSTSTIADGAASGLFPIGTSTDYRPMYVTAPLVAPALGGTISVAHVGIPWTTASSFTDINITIDRIFNSYWAITTGNGLVGGTYNLRAGGTGFTGITDYTQLRLIQAGSSVGINGTNGGSNSNPQVNRTGLTALQLPNYFYIGYPSGSGPLPITLLSFNARPEQSLVKVNWATATEINSDYFSVERSSDGEDYRVIKTAQAAGNSYSNKYYSIEDNEPINGWSYYRLKETDFDGAITYSAPVAVYFDTVNDQFKIVSAHILNDEIIVTLLSAANEYYRLDFYDCIGRLVYHKEGNLMSGLEDVMIPLASNKENISILTARTSNQFISKIIH